MTGVATEVATKERLLDVAERLFAEQGFESVSLRQITAEAGANLAAVNYHFGSKDELILAIVRKWLHPLNASRLRLLSEVEAAMEAGGGRATWTMAETIERIVEAFVRPALELHRDSEQSRHVFFRLIGRCMIDSKQAVSATLVAEFREVIDRFGAAFGRCLPQLGPEEVTMRMMFMAGAMAHTILNVDRIAVFHGRRMEVPETDDLVRQMVRFVAGGFQECVPGAHP